MQMLHLLSFFSLTVNILCAPVVIRVDPSRPTALYQGPSTNRRDPRNNYRPFKSIIVTSKPFGLDSNNKITKNNNVNSTAIASTTSSPLLGIAPPTIPFFTISCTVGSSCSQIIQSPSRNFPTPKPTFKPYTKGLNRTLTSSFLPTVLTLNFGVQNSSTTTPLPIKSLRRTRTTTTQSPPVTTALPPSDFATPLSVYSDKHNPVVNNPNQWKWPESYDAALPEKRKPEVNSNKVSDSASVPVWNLKGSPNSTPQLEWPIRKSSYWSKFPASTNNYNINKKANDIKATTFRPILPIQSSTPTYTRDWMAMLAASLAGLNNHNRVQSNIPQGQVMQQVRKNETTKNPIKPQIASESKFPAMLSSMNPDPITRTAVSDGKVAGELVLTQSTNYNEHNLHEIISTKGNKISIITGPNTRKKINNITPQNQHIIPPEISITSHAIGLRVKPKSLSAPFLETIQGVSVETDGEDMNLSKMIMRDHPIDIPRPSRYLSSFGNRGWIRQI